MKEEKSADFPCSRNAQPEKGLVGRAYNKKRQASPLKQDRGEHDARSRIRPSRRADQGLLSILRMRFARCSLISV
jgi:hypothetical protein